MFKIGGFSLGNVLNLTEKDILNKIIESSHRYRDNLLNKNMLIISYDRKLNKYSFIECEFLAKHFQHLTGVKIRPSQGAPTYNPNISSAKNFFDACVNNRLSMTDYRIPKDGTVELKMVVIIEVLSFIYSTNMMGTFSGAGDKLVTEKLIGNVRGSLGFVNDRDKPGSSIKVPNTVLNVDIRNVSSDTNAIVCIFEKSIKADKYTTLRYLKQDKPKKNNDNPMSKPVDFLEGVKTLEIVKEKVDKSCFEIN